MFRKLLIILMCFPLNYSFARSDEIKKIKEGLKKIQEAQDSNKPLKKNPLEDLHFQGFASRGYLHYYRALAYSLLIKDQSNADKMTYIESALKDLNLASDVPYFDSNLLKDLTLSLMKQRVEIAFQMNNSNDLIESIEALPQSELSSKQYTLYYAYALYKRGDIETFKHFARANLDLLQNKDLLNSFKIQVDWNSTLSSLTDDSFVRGRNSSKKDILKLNSEDVLYNPNPYLEHLTNSVYMSDADAIYKIAKTLYLSLYEKGNPNKFEKNYVHSFQKKMYFFTPNIIDDLISVHWKRQELQIAKNLSQAFLKNYPGNGLYPKVLYNLGRLQEDAQKYSDAFKTFKKLIKLTDIDPYSELAYFRAGWIMHLLKKKKEALPYFKEYIERFPQGRYASTAEYFILMYQPHEHINKNVFDNYLNRYPLNLYTLLLIDDQHLGDDALLKLLSSDTTFQSIAPMMQNYKADIPTLKSLQIYKELLEFDLKKDAIKRLKKTPMNDQNGLLNMYLASEFHKLQDANGETSMLLKVFSSYDELRKHIPWKGLFPEYELDSIKAQLKAQNLKISPYFILSLIRQESAFDPEVRSSANAYGLMQLTPGTAKMSADLLNYKNYSLTQKDDNLKIGIKTIADLLVKYKNRMDYALCGYNAGEQATDLWIDLRGHLSPLEFIESIPFHETRGYVKNILRNYAIYRTLYEKRPTPLIAYELEHTF